jgi:threonine dehydratase
VRTRGKARCDTVPMPSDYLARILTARVYDVAHETPLEIAPNLSRRLGNSVLLKREDDQPVFSFKLRGAYNKMVHLTAIARARGVVAASAGNHAQGVALAAQHLHCPAVIVMPTTTPRTKIEAVRARGAEVVLVGDTYDEAEAVARDIERDRNLTFVHPFDDPDVIAGQGTIAMEFLRQHPDPIHAVFVPVGGGGLIAGIGTYVKRLRPDVRVIGVEPVDADAMAQSLAAGKRVRLKTVGLFADGVAVRQVGRETFRMAQDVVDEIITVDTDDICAAIKDVFEDTRSILEPAGALGVAGLKAYVAREGVKGEHLIAIASGANMNFDRLRFAAERADVGEGREAILAVTIPERPGSFAEFCELIGARSITEFNYRIADAAAAHVFVGVEVESAADTATLIKRLGKAKLPTLDLTNDEMAKLHIRHLVGGRSPLAGDELLLRFEFPERPGALMRFLDALSGRWNISLFHYRNHGSDDGHVLCGLQVPTRDRAEFRRFLAQVGYAWWDETANPAYTLFLK